MKNWKERIAAMLAVREKMQKSNEGMLFEFYPPESAADISKISAVQRKLSIYKSVRHKGL